MLLSNIAIVGTWIRDGRSYNKIAIQVTLGMRRVWCVVPALDGLDVFFCFFLNLFIVSFLPTQTVRRSVPINQYLRLK